MPPGRTARLLIFNRGGVSMFGPIHRGAAAALAIGAVAIGAPAAAVFADPSGDHGRHHHQSSIAHVLLVSVNGLHQSDLEWYVGSHPGSELAKLAGSGAQYTGAHTPDPLGLLPGHDRAGHRRQPAHDRRLLRRRVQPRRAARRDDLLPRPADRRRSHLRLARRQERERARRRSGSCRPARPASSK